MATETTALATVRSTETMTIEEIKHMQAQVHKLLQDVMKEGIDNDYAIIPGTKKQSLLKPGAEKICNLFRFVAEPRIEEFRDGEDVTFRAYVALSSPSGRLLGMGVGQASTKETKFAWRRAVCAEEYEATEPNKRRLKWRVDNSGDATTELQVRENPADKENNMLKMAKKRGLIDAVLTVTGCSNLFTQDREDDLEEGAQNGAPPQKAQAKPQHAAPAKNGPIITAAQSGRFYGIWKNANRTAADVKIYLERVCGVDDSRKMPVKFYEEACRWAATQEPVPAVPAAAATQATASTQITPEEADARIAFSILTWDEKTQARFADQYAHDWKRILGELKILLAKRKDAE